MMILLMIISLGLIFICYRWCRDLMFIPSVLFLISFCLVLYLGYDISRSSTLDEQIVILTDENKLIDTELGVLLDQYSDKHRDSNSVPNIAFLPLYPELSENDLVMDSITRYRDNVNKVRELRQRKLDIRVNKWWLYFGR